MPILHIVTIKWKPEVTEADVQAATDFLVEMRQQIPEIKSYILGPNLHLRPAGADFGFAAIVETPEDLDTYLDHPLHLEAYAKHLSKMVAERNAVQLSIESGTLL